MPAGGDSKYGDDSDFEDDFEGSSSEDDTKGTSKPAAKASPVAVPTPTAGKGGVPMPMPKPAPGGKAVPMPMPKPSSGSASGTATPSPVPAPATAEQAVAQALENGMWKKQYDPNSKKNYYFHIVTKKTTWDLAAELGFSAPAPAPKASAANSSNDSLSDAGLPILKLPDKILARSRGEDASSSKKDDTPRSDEDDDDEDNDGGAKSANPVDSLAGSFNEDDEPPALGRNLNAATSRAFNQFVAFGDSPVQSTPRDDRDGSGSDRSPMKNRQSLDSARRESEQPISFEKKDSMDASGSRGSSIPSAPFNMRGAAAAFGGGSISSGGNGAFASMESNATVTIGGEEGEAADRKESVAAKPAAVVTSTGVAKKPPGVTPAKTTISDDSSAFSTASQAVKDLEVAKQQEKERISEQLRKEKEAEDQKIQQFVQKQQPAAAAQAAAPGPAATTMTPPVSTTPTPLLAPQTAATQQPLAGSAATGGGVAPAPSTTPSGRDTVPVAAVPVPAPTSQATYIVQQGAAPPGGVVYATAADTSGGSQRASEIRETSNAIERLVRAYATLKQPQLAGGSAEHRPLHTDPSTSSAQSKFPSSYHSLQSGRGGVLMGGDVDTFFGSDVMATDPRDDLARARVQQLQYSRSKKAGQGINAPNDQLLHDLTRLGANENVLEEEILDMVLGMMSKDAQVLDSTLRSSNAHRQRGIASTNAKRGPIEKVSVEDHRSYTSDVVSNRPLAARVNTAPSGAAASWGSGPSGNIAEWDTINNLPADSLQQMLMDNLHKYVLRHIANNSVPAYFGRLVLIDLMTISLDVIQSSGAFGSLDDRNGKEDGDFYEDAAQECNVVFVYEGPMHASSSALAGVNPMKKFSQQAIQALPFESTTPEDGGISSSGGARPCFRLEHWVTRKKMWAIVAALSAALRHIEQVVNDQYAPFRTGGNSSRTKKMDKTTAASDPLQTSPESPYYVCEGPLFSVLPMRPATNAAKQPKKRSSSKSADLSSQENRKGDDAEATLLAKRRKNKFDADPDSFFGLHQDQIEGLAYSTSSIALEVLEDVVERDRRINKAKRRGDDGDDEDGKEDEAQLDAYELQKRQRRREVVDEVVADTVVELLGDESIRAAIKRRAQAKLDEVYSSKAQQSASSPAATASAAHLTPEDERKRNSKRIELAQSRTDILIRRLREEMNIEQ